MKWFKNLSTRNKLLFVVCVFVIIYTAIDIMMGFVSMPVGYIYQLDSTLTSELFGFAKWVVGTGAAITVAKTFKGDARQQDASSDADNNIDEPLAEDIEMETGMANDYTPGDNDEFVDGG